jgi:transposase, IS30 family
MERSAAAYHSWERGTNENTNGLVRQDIPKCQSMKYLTQARCAEIARRLNKRSGKQHSYFSPIEILALYTSCPATARGLLRTS